MRRYGSRAFASAAMFVYCGCQPTVGKFTIENGGKNKIEDLRVDVSGTAFSYPQIGVGEIVSEDFIVNRDSNFDFKYTASGSIINASGIGYVTRGLDNRFVFKIVGTQIFVNGQEAIK